jgi:hypothetical protein
MGDEQHVHGAKRPGAKHAHFLEIAEAAAVKDVAQLLHSEAGLGR